LIAQGFALTWATSDRRGRVRSHAAVPCPRRQADGLRTSGFSPVPRCPGTASRKHSAAAQQRRRRTRTGARCQNSADGGAAHVHHPPSQSEAWQSDADRAATGVDPRTCRQKKGAPVRVSARRTTVSNRAFVARGHASPSPPPSRDWFKSSTAIQTAPRRCIDRQLVYLSALHPPRSPDPSARFV
jgi:hypothetical protein